MSKVLISGAGVAGPALAYWLSRRGDDCTVVERAPALRIGGQAVDFRGPIHREALTRMGLWQAIHERRTTPGDLLMLDPRGRLTATLPAVMMAGDVEILRGDLCRLLYDRTHEKVHYRFSDHIVSLADSGAGVDVELASGVKERFDFVVGTDGLHSGVRALAFGDERQFLRHHGYRIATFALPNRFDLTRGAALYTVPGRGVMIGVANDHSDARALLVSTGEPFGAERRDAELQKTLLAKTFGDMGWQVPRVIDALAFANDLYVDALASIHVNRYWQGRVVLLGDAAYGGTLGGQGTSLAVVGAYVLAGELARAKTPEDAFARYETRMRPYATRCQKGAANAGMFFAPRTRLGLTLRNWMYRLMTTRPFIGLFERMVKDAATDFTLPEYVESAAALPSAL